MNKKFLKIAIIFLPFALGMFVNKMMSLEAKPAPTVATISPGETVIDLDINPELYNCKTLHRLDDTQVTFCVRKEELVRENGKNYVRGVTIPKENKIFIDKNLDTCSIAHELGHLEGLNENQAYDLSSLCYQLTEKGIWKN